MCSPSSLRKLPVPMISASGSVYTRAVVATSSTAWSRSVSWSERATAPTRSTPTRRTARVFLDRNQPTYIGGILEMANARLYPLLGRSHRSAANRRAAERDQGDRPSRCSTSSTRTRRGSSSSCTRWPGSPPGTSSPRREVRLQPLYDAHRCRRRDRAAVDHRRAAPPAPALQHLRPPRRAPDRRTRNRGRR